MAWQDSAACKDSDLDWFPVNRHGRDDTEVRDAIEACRKVCDRCPVFDPCADYAVVAELNSAYQPGIWAGVAIGPTKLWTRRDDAVASQLAMMRRRRRAAVAA